MTTCLKNVYKGLIICKAIKNYFHFYTVLNQVILVCIVINIKFIVWAVDTLLNDFKGKIFENFMLVQLQFRFNGVSVILK